MKNKYFPALAALLGALTAAYALKVPAGAAGGVITLPDGARVSVELALTPEAQARGLMFRETLPRDEGMLFVFQEEAPRTFWMKNTLIDLDMVFLDAELKVLKVFHRVPRAYKSQPEREIGHDRRERGDLAGVPGGKQLVGQRHAVRQFDPGVRLHLGETTAGSRPQVSASGVEFQEDRPRGATGRDGPGVKVGKQPRVVLAVRDHPDDGLWGPARASAGEGGGPARAGDRETSCDWRPSSAILG